MTLELNKAFNQQEFTNWVEEFLPEFSLDVRKVEVTSGFRDIKSIYTLGESSIGVRVYVIEMEKDPSNRKVGLTKDSFTLLKQYGTPNAIIAYYSTNTSQWRVSLLTSTPIWNEGKILTKLSNPKRQSYVLGPTSKINTPTKFLIRQGIVNDFKDLKDRFSLDVVNKDFYNEIAESFTKLVGGTRGEGKNKKTFTAQLKLPSIETHSQASLEFAVRLIGRVIFCWFLREKMSPSGFPLIPKELLSLEAISQHDNYYHNILEPIFFEVLNKKKRDEVYQNKPYSLIPYLNGGLFSPQEDVDFYKRRNGEESPYINTLIVPDEWLKQFFQILETYNFTIDENTSFDEELSIDPEMLGRIFENLLAEINPSTGESIRKSTGSYYTPRPIVEYMVDESLLLYLNQKTQIEEDKLRAVISYDLSDDSQFPLSEFERQQITDALEKVKILDPACGSGAFPIGALQKIVFILQQVDPDGQLWFRKQLLRTSPELRRVIEREFANKNFDYIRKLGVIRENIYGVDIQPIASEISRLRCFLTLIVDQHVHDDIDNRGIQPLPNLDFKFVTANSLINLPSLEYQFVQQYELFEDQKNIMELKEVRDQYFNADGIEREQLKTQFAQIQNSMLLHIINMKKTSELTHALSNWNPFSHKSTPWFDPEWMFGIKDGFDIIIANPPYDVYQGEKKDEIETIKNLEIYHISKGGKLNMYKLFLAKSAYLQKNDGILCEIFQNSFLADSSAKLLRKYFFENQQIIKLDSFPERDNVKKRVFEAVKMSVCILITKKVKLDNYTFKLNVWESKYMDSGFSVDYTKNDISRFDPQSLQIPLLDKNEKELFSKVYQYEHAPIKCIEGELNMTFHKKYFSKDPKNPKIIKGAAVQRYFLTDKISQGEVEYLNLQAYLNDFNSSEKSKHYQFPRIVMQGITGVDDERRLIMTLLPIGLFCANSCNYVIPINNNYSLHYLLGLYNSKLINWIFKKTSTNSNVNCYEIESLPIPKIDNFNSQIVLKIENLVNLILNKTENENYLQNILIRDQVNEYEKQIDQLVYELYKLDEKEIEIVERSRSKKSKIVNEKNNIPLNIKQVTTVLKV